MKIVIVGAGEVGGAIASGLCDNHDVTVVDIREDRVDELNYSMDLLAIHGDCTDVDTLEDAEVESADMFLAATDDDETNIVACATARAISDAFTVARIKDSKYLRTWRRTEQAFGIDFMVATNLLAAESIARVAALPTARAADFFADGTVQMAEFDVCEGSPIAGETVEEADQYDSLTFAAVLRNGDVEIARGGTRIDVGDRIVVIGSSQSVHEFARDSVPEAMRHEATEVVIAGGSEIGYHVARLLNEQGLSTRLVEEDETRARKLAENLPDTLVMHSDATDAGFLEREHVGDADILVSALDSDEKNLLESLLADELGIERTISVIDQSSYVGLFERIGVDVAINPRNVVAEEITRFTQSGNTENIAFIETDKAEVLEIEIDEESVLAGRPIQESMSDLPAGVVIGAITRNGEMVIPRGETVIQPGDHVIVFAEFDVVDGVTAKL
ncbi:trk system potassium uptake protein [Halalkaliarchaeum desulfuricum]|uniref:Trk system potassium uptake protein n=1 Tax=Halalkaliarchaeum desulfuricum TaxID=2055893 RepID=A0A343TNM6_9EURY|nr:Trk system potassium transporter TrkA [Halalkaliarchaeum desulfuricum]AUX10698.1 trk system potassium uptake protein [Halalkaliarchaeum desulfuricum]